MNPESPLVPNTTTAIVMMTSTEARAAVTAINHHLGTARRLLLDLYEREGWRSLGYASWRECVVAEFNQSQSALYYQLQAAGTERELLQHAGSSSIDHFQRIGNQRSGLSDRMLREIGQLPPEQRHELAVEIARDLTQKQLRAVIADKQAAARRSVVVPRMVDTAGSMPASVRIDCADTADLPWPSDTVNLFITSVPYGLDVTTNGYIDLPYPELLERISIWAVEWYRVAFKPTGRLVVVCPFDRSRPPEAFVASDVHQRIVSTGWTFKRCGIWFDGSAGAGTDRGSASPSAPNLAVPAEAMLLFHAGQWRDPAESGHDLDHDSWLSWCGPRWLWTIPGAHHPDYPAVFPLDLGERLIRLFSWRDSVVADPMAGSGTVGAATLRVGGRSVLLNDVNPQAVALMRRRLASLAEAEAGVIEHGRRLHRPPTAPLRIQPC